MYINIGCVHTHPFTLSDLDSERFEICLETGKKLIRVNAVGSTGLLKSFTAGEGAAHAVHSNCLKCRHSLRAAVNDLGN